MSITLCVSCYTCSTILCDNLPGSMLQVLQFLASYLYYRCYPPVLSTQTVLKSSIGLKSSIACDFVATIDPQSA